MLKIFDRVTVGKRRDHYYSAGLSVSEFDSTSLLDAHNDDS